jgi:hypothetical protein
MESLYTAFFADPVYYIGAIFALFGAWGLILILMGIGSGMQHIFTYNESESHMAHVRTRALWGVLMLMATWGFWELFRVIIGQAPVTYLWAVLILLTPLWIPWLKGLFAGGGGGH